MQQKKKMGKVRIGKGENEIGSSWNSFWLKVIYILLIILRHFPRLFWCFFPSPSFCSPLILIYFIKSLGGALWMLSDSLLSAIRLRFQQCASSRLGVWVFLPTVEAHQAPLSMEFSRQEYWSGLPFPSPGSLPNPEIDLVSPALAEDRVFISLHHLGRDSSPKLFLIFRKD